MSEGITSGCIEWTGALNSSGYGWRTVKGKQISASRYAWIEKNGPIPDGLNVLHRCDNRKCVNIDHLYLGTHSDNMRDRTLRGRFRGQKLNLEIVKTIRDEYSRGVSSATLSKKYNITSGYVRELVRWKTWIF